MEWYHGDRVTDVIVPKDQCTWSRFPSLERWQQWGANAMESFDSPDKLGNEATDFSCESLMDDGEMHGLVSKGDQAEISGVRGRISESSIYWTALLNNQDYQLHGLPGTNQTGEKFMNSLLVDDICDSEHFHFYGSPRSQGTCSTGNNLTSDMLLDSSSDLYYLHDVGSYEHLNAEEFPYSLDWEKKQFDTSHCNPSDMMNNAVPQYNTPLGNVQAPLQQTFASRRVGDRPSVEETVLQEFGSAMQKMTDESRLCFRDALYRLASNSEKHSSDQGDNLASEKPLTTALPDQNLRCAEREACETRTNRIDRAIADLMFNKPYQYGYGERHQSGAPHFQHCTAGGDAEVPNFDSSTGNATQLSLSVFDLAILI